MHKFFHVFYIVIILALLWFGNFSSEHPSSSLQAEISFEKGFAKGFATARVEASEGKMSTDVQQSKDLTRTAAETNGLNDDEVPEAVQEQQQDDKIAAQLREFTTYPDRMLQESVDLDWAYLVESDVERLFESKDELGDLPLQSVTCRTSICELKVSNQSGMRIEDLIRVQQTLSKQPWYSEDYTSQFNIKNEDDHHSVFIVRPQP
ncbi:hypothetical protein CWE22_07155 [Pseudidiomarina aestuarii]|uniref:Uncharacterized protein n=1 Tax=Pseudidiomarina aestuarii TaxID=624146 RepID=A0A7Z7EU94_9GAMM|nr:hypothetical protein [Pseudidiomarina aestuarii]RUO41918.1 hypothetical protein CWE22_07155 [Pseudidiomarina aestuarii]